MPLSVGLAALVIAVVVLLALLAPGSAAPRTSSRTTATTPVPGQDAAPEPSPSTRVSVSEPVTTVRPLRSRSGEATPPAVAETQPNRTVPTELLQYIAQVRRIRELFESVLDQIRLLEAERGARVISRARVAVLTRLLPGIATRAAEEVFALDAPTGAETHQSRLGGALSRYAIAAGVSDVYQYPFPPRDTAIYTSFRFQLGSALSMYLQIPDDPRLLAL